VLYKEMMQEVMDSWTAAEASRIYTEAVAAHMSNDDLRAAIDFYTSEEGTRTLEATNTAVASLQTYIQEETSRALQSAMTKFSARLAEVVAADAKGRQDAAKAGKKRGSR
jgi:hypothetical protein